MPFVIKLVGEYSLEPPVLKLGVGKERESSTKTLNLASVLPIISQETKNLISFEP